MAQQGKRRLEGERILGETAIGAQQLGTRNDATADTLPAIGLLYPQPGGQTEQRLEFKRVSGDRQVS